MFLSVIIKNLNWEILTKKLVTFKRWDWVKGEKFQYGVSLKNPNFTPRKTNLQGELPEKGGDSDLDSLQTSLGKKVWD